MWGKGEAYTGFWLGNLRERDRFSKWCRWEDNIEMDLQEVECGGMDWIDLNFDRDSWRVFVNTVMKLRA